VDDDALFMASGMSLVYLIREKLKGRGGSPIFQQKEGGGSKF
jgi:hypothetical protein